MMIEILESDTLTKLTIKTETVAKASILVTMAEDRLHFLQKLLLLPRKYMFTTKKTYG